MDRKYSDYAIVFNWEILNNEQDIGKWEMLFEENQKVVNGIGIGDFIETLSQLSENIINVIYVKNLNLFEVIGENYFSYHLNFMAAVKNKQINFFNLNIFEHVCLVNWDNFFKQVNSCNEFLRRLTICREKFKGQNKNKLGLQAHYRITLASDQWFDIVERFYLKSPWSNSFRENLLPKTEEELRLFLAVNKASYSFSNPKFKDKEIEQISGDDISSSHSGFIVRKKYPSSESTQLTNPNEIFKIIDKNWFAWIGEFKFQGLKLKVKLPIDLRKFGKLDDDDEWVLTLTNAHWDAFKRLFSCENVIPISFFYYQNKELPRNYANMVNQLYIEKEFYKHHEDDFVSSIFKFRTELPFGQSIKNPVYYQSVEYDSEGNEFVKNKLNPPTFNEVIKELKKRALPFQIGIWTAAYSWAEEINMILDIGVENVIYGDTDCVWYIGEKGRKIIDEHNKAIDKEFEVITAKRKMTGEIGNQIGRWKSEGKVRNFKAIGIKWYKYEKWNEKKNEWEIIVKAAGADTDVLKEWLKEQENSTEAFNKEMCVPKLFKNVNINRINKTVFVNYNSYMGDQLIKEINEKTNGFFI